MPLTLPPDQFSARREWLRWSAHVRRFKVAIAGLCGIGLACAATVSLWPLLLVPPGLYALRRWRVATDRQIDAALTPAPILPSDADDWDTALRLRTGKSQRDLDRSLHELLAEQATQHYLARQREQ